MTRTVNFRLFANPRIAMAGLLCVGALTIAGITTAVGVATGWPEVRKFAHIHPDYAYGRNAFDHFTVAIEKLLGGSQVVSQAWPKLGTTDFTPHITTALASGADCLVTSCWGGDYIALYKQGL